MSNTISIQRRSYLLALANVAEALCANSVAAAACRLQVQLVTTHGSSNSNHSCRILCLCCCATTVNHCRHAENVLLTLVNPLGVTWHRRKVNSILFTSTSDLVVAARVMQHCTDSGNDSSNNANRNCNSNSNSSSGNNSSSGSNSIELIW
jgi:hypothetical protein